MQHTAFYYDAVAYRFYGLFYDTDKVAFGLAE